MNISLTPELEKYVHKQVASERYQTASEVIRQAIRMMQQSEAYDKARLEALRQDIQLAVDASDRGEYVELRTAQERKAFLEDIKKRGRERLARKQRRRVA